MGRPILWNKNLWNLCVSAGWIYKLSVVYIFFEWTIDIHVILYFVCKIIRLVCFFFTFVVPFLCVIHRSHAIYTAVSGTFRYSSNFLPFLLFIKFSHVDLLYLETFYFWSNFVLHVYILYICCICLFVIYSKNKWPILPLLWVAYLYEGRLA